MFQHYIISRISFLTYNFAKIKYVLNNYMNKIKIQPKFHHNI
jgi:hypothetical protein